MNTEYCNIKLSRKNNPYLAELRKNQRIARAKLRLSGREKEGYITIFCWLGRFCLKSSISMRFMKETCCRAWLRTKYISATFIILPSIFWVAKEFINSLAIFPSFVNRFSALLLHCVASVSTAFTHEHTRILTCDILSFEVRIISKRDRNLLAYSGKNGAR